MMDLRSLLDALGRAGLRLALAGDRLTVTYPADFPADALGDLKAMGSVLKTTVVEKDADLAAALATLDALADRPGHPPALLHIIGIRREVYAGYRDRLADHDLAGDARLFAARYADPTPPSLPPCPVCSRGLLRCPLVELPASWSDCSTPAPRPEENANCHEHLPCQAGDAVR